MTILEMIWADLHQLDTWLLGLAFLAVFMTARRIVTGKW
jgi:hypothetical protein